MMNYCCQKFEVSHRLPSEMGMNIRIIKYKETEVKFFDKSDPFRFFITKGYSENEKNVLKIMVYYCPFCGANLKEKYNKDKFINDTKHFFISF